MNRHNEVTNRFKNLKQKHLDRLEEFDERLSKHESRSEEVYEKFGQAIEIDEAELRDMERDIEEMAGNGGETVKTDDKFQGDSKKA